MQKLIYLLCFISFIAFASPINNLQDHQLIRQAVKQYILQHHPNLNNQRNKITISNIDSRLKLSQCSQPLSVFIPSSSKHKLRTVGVRCETPSPWTIYVSVDVKVYLPIVTAKMAILKGQVINSENLNLVEYDINDLRDGYYRDIQQVDGFIAKRNISPNTIISPRLLLPPLLVHRGETVLISASHHGLSIEMKGIALSDGVLNRKIRVRNRSSKRIIEAYVIGRGRVKVPL